VGRITAEEILEHAPARLAIGQLCRLARHAYGGSINRWAAALGVTRQSVLYYEGARMCPIHRVRERIARYGQGLVTMEQLDRAAYLFSCTYSKMRGRPRGLPPQPPQAVG